MSPDERYFLSTFLRGILFSDDFSYLLFGSKPIAAGDVEKPTSFYFSSHCLSPSNLKIGKGFEVFKKNQHLFSSSNIIVHLSEDADYYDLVMINKKNLLKTLEQHINDFKQVLGPEITTEYLFTQITENAGIQGLVKVINYHEALLGILLGYGRNNAWLFHQKSTMSRRMNQFEPLLKWDGTLEKKFAEEVQKMTFFSDDPHEYKYTAKSPRLPLPHFMADPNSLETKMLKEQYGKERENMKRLFAKQNYVEATLQKLMGE